MAAQVIKKVKEHHKKKAKLDKKLGRKAKKEKDPGIPGQWPFKQDLLKELEWEKQRAAAEQKRKKEERRLAQVGLRQYQMRLCMLTRTIESPPAMPGHRYPCVCSRSMQKR